MDKDNPMRLRQLRGSSFGNPSLVFGPSRKTFIHLGTNHIFDSFRFVKGEKQAVFVKHYAPATAIFSILIFDLDFDRYLDFGTEERVLPQGIYM